MARTYPLMTQGHFQLIADTIKAMDVGPYTREYIAAQFVEALRRNNPRFRESLFLAAATREDKA